MNRKSTQPPFTAEEIALMQDVSKQHVEVSALTGRGIGMILRYRTSVLGINMRGSNYDLEKLRDSVDWSMSSLQIARQLKVSPDTVEKWRRDLRKRMDPGTAKLTEADKTAIAKSNAPSAELAAKYEVSVWTINHVRRQLNAVKFRGRPRKVVADYPSDYDWAKPTRQVAADLGLSWLTADRLRTEALRQRGFIPMVSAFQLDLPGFGGATDLPEELSGIDWSANTSLLADHLGLDRHEVMRFKSLARRHRRLNKK